jgi:PAT family beta-lactamase induction signal transducer AmpG
MSSTDEPRRGKAVAWVSTTYFAEGYPYSIVVNIADALFNSLGASLQAIGLTALFHVPWNLKLLWGPLVDRYETKRAWMIATQFVLAVLLVVMSFAMDAADVLAVATVLFVALAVVAATQDIAIDGYYLEALDDKGQAALVGLRAALYRVATIAAFGGFLMIADWASWRLSWLIAAAVMFALAIFHRSFLPRVETRRLTIVDLVRAALSLRVLAIGVLIIAAITLESRYPVVRPAWARLGEHIPILAQLGLAEWVGIVLLLVLVAGVVFRRRFENLIRRRDSDYARSFLHFLEQPRIGTALALIVTWRVGESFLVKMRLPFIINECEVSEGMYGLLSGTFGFVAMILGSLLGGLLIAKHGMRRWLWPFLLAQNVLNLSYCLIAMPDDPSSSGLVVIGGVILLENFGAGLGTAAFMVYIMRCCDPRHRAAHMAIVTALMSLGFTAAGVLSGYIAAEIGFAWYFFFTFVATIPSMVIVPFAPHLDRRETVPERHERDPDPPPKSEA